MVKKVDFTQQTAKNFMRVATEFSNVQTFGHLTQSKIFALLDLPSEERADFVAQTREIKGQTKTVDEKWTTKEFQHVINDKKVAEQRPYG